jgi:hypothetical protein
MGLHGLEQGYLYLYLYLYQTFVSISLISYTCCSHRPTYSSWLIILVLLGQKYKLWIFSLCNLLPSSLLYPNILLSTLFSNTFSLCSSLTERDQVSLPYKITDQNYQVYYYLKESILKYHQNDFILHYIMVSFNYPLIRYHRLNLNMQIIFST